jgi:multidrug efflux pump subunit AcrA (membrane-fusion protein)
MAYNPYSSGTDFGFALRNTLNNLLAHKQGQAQADKEQQRYDEEQAKADAKIRREEAKAAREAQLAEKKFELDKRAADETYRKSLNPPKTQHEETVDALIKGGFAQDAGGAEMLIGAYETAAQKHEAEEKKERAGEAKIEAREAERDKNAENKDLLGRAKDLTIKITGKIRGIEKDPLRGPKDPQIKDLTVMNNFIQRRMNKAIAGNLNDADKDMLNKVAMAIESGDVGSISDTGVPQEQSPITPPPAQESNPEEVQLTAREIMTRVAASGKQLSEEGAVALAIQYLKSKQNVR